MIVKDNVLPFETQYNLLEKFIANRFVWRFQKENFAFGSNDTETQSIVEDENVVDNVQFFHTFFLLGALETNRENFDIIIPLLEELENKYDLPFYKMIRCKANILLPSRIDDVNKYNLPHRDDRQAADGDLTSVVYYVNDSDGDTVLFKEDLSSLDGKPFTVDMRVSPKMGRALIFDSTKYHTSSCPRKSKYRIVLNLVYSNNADIYDGLNERERNAVGFIYKRTKFIPHSGKTFFRHLYNTFKILKDLDLSEDVCLAGLYHSVYDTEYFKVGLGLTREQVSSIIGERANELAEIFCLKGRDEIIRNNSLSLEVDKHKALLYIQYANLVEQYPERRNEFLSIKEIADRA